MTKKEHEKIIKEIEIAYPEGSGAAMTLADMIRNEGLEQGKKEIALNAIKKGMETSLIAELTGLSEAEIKRLADS